MKMVMEGLNEGRKEGRKERKKEGKKEGKRKEGRKSRALALGTSCRTGAGLRNWVRCRSRSGLQKWFRSRAHNVWDCFVECTRRAVLKCRCAGCHKRSTESQVSFS